MTLKEQQIAYYENQRLLSFIAMTSPTTPMSCKPQFLYKIEFFQLRIEQLSRE